MMLPSKWLLKRSVFLAIGVLAFNGITNIDSNFDPLAGLVCGTAAFLFTFFVVTKNSTVSEEKLLTSSPCWPPWKYPQAYWSTTGALLFVSAVLNIPFHLNNLVAVRVYVGLVLVGLGMLTGAMGAHYRIRRRGF
jgi:hypothetical protein